MLIEIDKKDIGRYAIKDIMVANDRYGSWVSLESMIGEDHIHLMVNEEVEVSAMPEADAILRYDPETRMYSRLPKISTTLLGSVTPPDDKTKEYITEMDKALDILHGDVTEWDALFPMDEEKQEAEGNHG